MLEALLMARRKIKTPLTDNNLPSKLYVCFCIDAMLKMMKGDEVDDKVVELLIPLLEELQEGQEILS